MKFKTLQSIIMTVVCIGAAHVADCQTSTNDLTVSADASLLLNTNDTRIFLTIHLVNSSDHELTVLTKHLNIGTAGSTNQMTIEVGYSGSVKHDGHTIVPSLYDFSPVTLKPNEEAFIAQEVSVPRSVTSATQFVVRYTISPEWAKRFALWSGSVESESFSPRVRTPR
jgi:hypothetical protein